VSSNRRILFRRTPEGVPVPEDFGADTVDVPKPSEGQFLSRTIYLSLDPYYRNVMKGSQIYQDRLNPGDPMIGETVAQVIESRHADFRLGDYVQVRNGWQQYALSNGAGVRKLDPEFAPLSTALGVLGMAGLTGYAGLVYLGEPKPGDTVVVSAAAGPVGSTVGQVARHSGCRAVGIAGSDDKCAFVVKELGFADCVNYKSGDLKIKLRQACPDGIDVYFDNVGGDTLVAVLANLARHARIVLCGMMNAYNLATPPPGPHLGPVVGARATMRGLIVYDYLHRLPDVVRLIGGWIRDGQFHYREDIAEGLDAAPEAFCRLMRGENFGKSLVRVGPERL
jgi:NADPH-dependent curcumin reductase CurA